MYKHSHPATDIYPYNIRNYLVSSITGESDDTSCTGVDIGHYANLFIRKYIYGKQCFNLFKGVILDVVCENL